MELTVVSFPARVQILAATVCSVRRRHTREDSLGTENPEDEGVSLRFGGETKVLWYTGVTPLHVEADY